MNNETQQNEASQTAVLSDDGIPRPLPGLDFLPKIPLPEKRARKSVTKRARPLKDDYISLCASQKIELHEKDLEIVKWQDEAKKNSSVVDNVVIELAIVGLICLVLGALIGHFGV